MADDTLEISPKKGLIACKLSHLKACGMLDEDEGVSCSRMRFDDYGALTLDALRQDKASAARSPRQALFHQRYFNLDICRNSFAQPMPCAEPTQCDSSKP